jgi:hypothetical protein
MPQPQARPPQPSFDASQAPHTAQPATPLMRQRVPSVQPAPAPVQAVSSPPSPNAVDRNADTRGYVPPAQARVIGSDTHRTDENGRTVAANMDLVFPRGHGAMPQSSTGGVGMSTPTSRRGPRSKTPAMITGMLLAFVALVPTGFLMKRVVPRAGATAAAVPLHTSDVSAAALPPAPQTVTPPSQATATGTSATVQTTSSVAAGGVASAAPTTISTPTAVAATPARPAPGSRPAGKSKPPEKAPDTPAAPAAKPAAATKQDGLGVDL